MVLEIGMEGGGSWGEAGDDGGLAVRRWTVREGETVGCGVVGGIDVEGELGGCC